jgi:drug/metabolite transporter (DMT)-like permease
MLLGTVLLWALNATVSKYLLLHGWHPLAYGTIRYLAAIMLFWVFTYSRERSFRIARRDLPLVAFSALTLFVNQLCFVYAVKWTTASTVALMFGTTPVIVGALTFLVGLGRLGRRFWAAGVVTFGGVGLVAVGSGGGLSGNLKGDLVALAAAATWAVYSMSVAPLMERYSPFRISSLVLALGWIPLATVAVPQLQAQAFSFGWVAWLGLVFAIVGPLFLTNILWFTAIERVGTPRAAVFSNLQPVFAVLFAIVLLSERLHGLQIAGGALIFAGVAIDRVRRPTSRLPSTPIE